MTTEINDHSPKCNRRSLLSGMAVAATGLGAAVAAAPMHASQVSGLQEPTSMRIEGLERNSEHYWTAVRELFRLRPGLIAMNAANLCPSSAPVTQTLFDRTNDIDADPSHENRAKYAERKEYTRQLLAEMLGASSDEIAITRNTSESNRAVIGGIDLKPGDEVLIWDQNHESNNVAWEVWSQRLGFSLKRVSTPDTPQSREQLLKPFVDAMTPTTRIVSFSQVSNVSSVALPAKQLCESIRARGALSLCDGAQTFGLEVQNLQDLGCDFYTGSAHKWLCGPRETGVLYVRSEAQSGLWPPMVTHDWEKASTQGARKFDNLGQRDDGRLEALGTAVQLYNFLGGDLIEARVRSHVAKLMAGLQSVSRKIHFLSPEATELRGGFVIFLYKGRNARETLETLYNEYGISAAAADLGDQTWVRLAPHIYNSGRDIDITIKAVKHLVS
ncbi:aminotransferase class V-fold PLP-dependent enzyme [Pseudomaricurvus alkylphenolicus]|uniref:aminotransferase class V-fold PLP-dependent enzyme n=1 Tax=Pseudomaricurvus alkylphenolicus TaxID=1306991 RepID=UPI00141DDA4B|nr:aminotransferase class V-fold PLP-dependent enzyme [Pseudomaricurvus alkylphenolicus]NIB38436.1 aminotransferase class V-fold PLP-dependent enzyme [Pseudomaricurvus alkylphenolicus]